MYFFADLIIYVTKPLLANNKKKRNHILFTPEYGN